MNISGKAEHCLRDTNIDFAAFFILDIAARDRDKAVVILAPRFPKTGHRFYAWHKGERYGFQPIERGHQ